ncbi:hypothetical protein BFAG_03740 [Bacteroides fragilis 3_1_12]|uniref:Uncharacterized protein n=1 Tax=Bacteroides fragilis 3_1_12 TaxID=457424 RepID=A0ABN0BQC0_BACFG|nr:hypothetical protein BFAG_03740 [Bacteroides fragilis 3_1_12]
MLRSRTYIGVLLTKSSPLAFYNNSGKNIHLCEIKKLSGEFTKSKGERSYFHK